eukprot:2710990-Pyramimonas_sp.AAC.1
MAVSTVRAGLLACLSLYCLPYLSSKLIDHAACRAKAGRGGRGPWRRLPRCDDGWDEVQGEADAQEK